MDKEKMEFYNENNVIRNIQQRNPVDNVYQLRELIKAIETQKVNIISHKNKKIEIPDLSEYVINNLPANITYLNKLLLVAYHIEKNKNSDKIINIYLDKFSKILDEFKIYHLLENEKFLKSLRI